MILFGGIKADDAYFCSSTCQGKGIQQNLKPDTKTYMVVLYWAVLGISIGTLPKLFNITAFVCIGSYFIINGVFGLYLGGLMFTPLPKKFLIRYNKIISTCSILLGIIILSARLLKL